MDESLSIKLGLLPKIMHKNTILTKIRHFQAKLNINHFGL